MDDWRRLARVGVGDEVEVRVEGASRGVGESRGAHGLHLVSNIRQAGLGWAVVGDVGNALSPRWSCISRCLVFLLLRLDITLTTLPIIHTYSHTQGVAQLWRHSICPQTDPQ